MKVRVEYTYEIDGEDLKALNEYHKITGGIDRDSLRQQLKDLGTSGIDEQIVEGRSRLEHEVEGD